MAAKKKSAPKRKQARKSKSTGRQPKHLHDRVAEHVDTTTRLHDLIRRCTELRDRGQLPKARKLLAQVEKLQKALQAMEAAMERSSPEEKPLK